MYKTLVDLLEEENADIAHCGYQMVFQIEWIITIIQERRRYRQRKKD